VGLIVKLIMHVLRVDLHIKGWYIQWFDWLNALWVCENSELFLVSILGFLLDELLLNKVHESAFQRIADH